MWKPGAERDHCPAHDRATEFVRGELQADASRRFEAHLESCGSCRDAVARLRETISLLEESVLEESGGPAIERVDVSDRVLARIDERKWRAVHDRRLTTRGLVGSLAAMLAVVAFLWMAGNRFFSGDDAGMTPERTTSTIDRAMIDPSTSSEESALDQARGWLVSAQEPDGSWEPRRWGGASEYRVALTALASLALSGDARPAAREATARAGRFLVRSQEKDGHLGAHTRSALYNHALGTLALTELAMTSESLEDSARRAAGYLVEVQTDEGAWGYVSGDRIVANDSISVWALQALVRARELDLGVDRRAIERGFDWFEGLVSREEPLTYRGHDGHRCGEASSPLVAFAVLTRGTDANTRSVHVALDRLMRQPEAAALCFYDSYFLARSSFAARHPALERFGARTRRVLKGSQVKTGQLSGSWEPGDRWSPVGGRLYTTALAALALKPADA